VEQLSALTGRSVEEIDPDGAGAEDDWAALVFCVCSHARNERARAFPSGNVS
jgi:hypothetical protein